MGGSGDCESGTMDELAVGEKRWCGLRRATRSARVRWRSCRREEDQQCSQVSPVELLALALPARGHVGRGRGRGVPAGGARSRANRAAGGRVRLRAVPVASWAAWPSASGETREGEAERPLPNRRRPSLALLRSLARSRCTRPSLRARSRQPRSPSGTPAPPPPPMPPSSSSVTESGESSADDHHQEPLSFLQPLGYSASACGYCSEVKGQRSRKKSSRSYGCVPILASLAPPATSGSLSASRATVAGLTPSAPTRTSTSSTAAGAGAAPTSTNPTSRAPAARSTRSTSTRTASSPRAASARSSSALPPLSARASARARSAGDPRGRRPHRRRRPRRREEQDRPRAATPSCTTRRPSPPRSRTRARARRRSRVRPPTGATSYTPVTGSAARPTSRSSTASRCVPRPRPLSPLLRARALILEPSHAVHRRAGELLGREVRPLQALPDASPASRCGRRSPRAGP